MSKLPNWAKWVIYHLYWTFYPGGGFSSFNEMNHYILRKLWPEEPIDIEEIKRDLEKLRKK